MPTKRRVNTSPTANTNVTGEDDGRILISSSFTIFFQFHSTLQKEHVQKGEKESLLCIDRF